MLNALVPEQWQASPEVMELLAALQPELDHAQDALEDLLAQLLIDTATWGLWYWERDYGVTAAARETLEERRGHVRGKLRGVGTVTRESLENMADGFVQGRTRVTERPDMYTVEMAFLDVFGVPSNLDDLKAVVRMMLPAHLAMEYIIRYRLWKDYAGQTWSQRKGQTWGQMRGA